MFQKLREKDKGNSYRTSNTLQQADECEIQFRGERIVPYYFQHAITKVS